MQSLTTMCLFRFLVGLRGRFYASVPEQSANDDVKTPDSTGNTSFNQSASIPPNNSRFVYPEFLPDPDLYVFMTMIYR